MADLDDFFAKKDKKKKTKKGFSKANTDVLAKNLEENERREMKADVAKGNLATSEATKLAFEESSGFNGEIGHSSQPGRKDEEWLDYENEKKDYSGLKIETLKVSETLDEDESDHEINEEGEKVVKIKKNDGGPWNKGGSQPGKAEGEESSDNDEVPEKNESSSADNKNPTNPTASSVVKSSYVPPHLRGSASSSSSNSMASGGPTMNPMRMGNRGRANRRAPDINNEMYFPSLGSAGQGQPSDMSRSGRDDFEEVRGGSGSQQPGPRNSEAPKLALGNKFDALRD